MDDNRDRECSECDEEDWVSEKHETKLKKIPDEPGFSMVCKQPEQFLSGIKSPILHLGLALHWLL